VKYHATDKAATLEALKMMALTDPAYKATLKKFYEKNTPQPAAFDSYWQNAVSSVAVTAPAFTITQADHSVLNSEEVKQQGKWMLVDYWGTWCTPCRQEHPQLDKFYKEFAKKNAEKFILLTVACSDTQSRVDEYMAQYKYVFPVVMSDVTIEKLFKVNSYPTKVLISPQGKYIVLPFGSDWVAFVKNYTGL
jgi:thiol-disulfide isomerase/thioredoxin